MICNVKVYCVVILYSIVDFVEVGVECFYEYFEDGLLLVEDGKVVCFGDVEVLFGEIGDVEVFEYCDVLIIFGFIDIYIYFLQIGMIVFYGE